MHEYDMITRDGRIILSSKTREEIEGMTSPCRCTCGRIFDLGAVKVLSRYADCTVFKLPCCGRTTDDRPAGWRSGPSYERLDRAENRR